MACWQIVVVVLALAAGTAMADGASEESALVATAPKKCQTPLCTWQCITPKCKRDCKPQCHPPECHMKCKKPACARCVIHCPKPQCKILCPKTNCPMSGCPQCKIVCDPAPQHRCVAKCTAPQTTCWPACNTNCWNKCKNNCGKPFCHLICRRPEAFGDICPSTTCKLPCSLPGPNDAAAVGNGPCCKCSNAAIAKAAMRFAEEMPGAELTRHIPRPSLLEVMSHAKQQETLGTPSCCPCSKAERKQELREEATSMDFERRDEIQRAHDREDTLQRLAAIGRDTLDKERQRKLEAVASSPLMSSYARESGEVGVNQGKPAKPYPSPIYPGFPSPVGARNEQAPAAGSLPK